MSQFYELFINPETQGHKNYHGELQNVMVLKNKNQFLSKDLESETKPEEMVKLFLEMLGPREIFILRKKEPSRIFTRYFEVTFYLNRAVNLQRFLKNHHHCFYLSDDSIFKNK